ncbi:MAG: prolipoprotein diacylglyceryl transferase family protein, partial [Chloroflexota bacterium]
MLPFITLGPLAIPSKPFVFIVGFFAALWLVDRIVDQIDAEPEWIRSMPFNSIILGLIGGRIVFSITHWEATLANPTSIIWPITFGYSLWGSVLTGLLAVAYSSKQQSVNPIVVLEALLEPILVLLGAWIVADYLGGPGFGTRSPFARVPIHPVQIYELIVIVMTFVV